MASEGSIHIAETFSNSFGLSSDAHMSSGGKTETRWTKSSMIRLYQLAHQMEIKEDNTATKSYNNILLARAICLSSFAEMAVTKKKSRVCIDTNSLKCTPQKPVCKKAILKLIRA